MSRSYRVGRGKPPKEHRFEKGRSGNPSGRPKAKVAPPLTSLAAISHILKVGQQPVRTMEGGKEVMKPLWEAAELKNTQMALGGSQRAMDKFRREHAAALAAAEQELSDQYQFWRQWKRDQAQAQLFCASNPNRKLPWPHPVDIRIDALSRQVRFLGPLDADELPLYLAVVEVADLYLIEAELTARGCGEVTPLVRYLRHQAYDAYRNAAPSLGGPNPDEGGAALLHQMTALVLDMQAVGISDLRARRTELFSKFCAALATLDLAVPQSPPLRMAVHVRRRQANDPKKRHRPCSIARNLEMRRSVHDGLGKGQGLDSLVRSIAKTSTSRSAVARYVRLYKRIKSSWGTDADTPPNELPASLRAFRKTFAHFLSHLSDRDLTEKERLRRSELPLKPEQQPRPGASEETINFIKAKLLGLDVEPPPEVLD